MNAPVSTEGVVRRVTVFRNGALVERRARVEPGSVELAGLPLLIAADTLRVKADLAAVHDVEERAALQARGRPGEDPAVELTQLELAVEELERGLQRVTDAERTLRSIAPRAPAEEDTAPLPDASMWLDAHEELSARADALAEERVTLEASLHEKREALRRRTMQSTDEAEPPRYSRAVRFRLEADGARDVSVEYFVPAARWVPSYTLHLEDGRARLALAALVSQASGEDWSQAELRFSTADLSRATTLPELLSWRIGRKQPPPAPRYRDLPDDLWTLFESYDRGTARPLPSSSTPNDPEPDDGFDFDESTGALGLEEPDEDEDSVSGSFAFESTIEAEEDRSRFEDSDDLEDKLRKKSRSAPPPPPAAAPMGAPMPPAEYAAAADLMAPPVAKSAAFFGGGGDGFARGGYEPEPVALPPEPLPPKLRYAYLRLRGPDEGDRGALHPVSPLEHLFQLVEDHEAAHESDLYRAMNALERAADRMRAAPLPNGTALLHGCAFHHVYDAPGAHDVPSDGVYHRLEVAHFDAPANIEFRAVPREAPEVYRYCVLEAPVGTPLPRGPLHVYEDDDFRVTSQLEQDGGGGALELNLGVEDALRLEGRVVNIRQSEKGLVSSRSSVEHAVSLRYRSSLQGAARLLIFERLPVAEKSHEKELSVELLEAAPEPERTGRGPGGDKLEGGLRWALEVEAGKESTVAYRYAIELPAKAEVIGGNRRE